MGLDHSTVASRLMPPPPKKWLRRWEELRPWEVNAPADILTVAWGSKFRFSLLGCVLSVQTQILSHFINSPKLIFGSSITTPQIFGWWVHAGISILWGVKFRLSPLTYRLLLLIGLHSGEKKSYILVWFCDNFRKCRPTPMLTIFTVPTRNVWRIKNKTMPDTSPKGVARNLFWGV